MRNGSVFRLQGPVRLNGDGSLLFSPAGGVCCIRWYGSQHDTQLIKSILQGNVWWAPFQSNNTVAWGARACVCGCARACTCMSASVCILEECLRSTQNKGQGHRVCLQYAFEIRSSAVNARLWRGIMIICNTWTQKPPPCDWLGDRGHTLPQVW